MFDLVTYKIIRCFFENFLFTQREENTNLWSKGQFIDKSRHTSVWLTNFNNLGCFDHSLSILDAARLKKKVFFVLPVAPPAGAARCSSHIHWQHQELEEEQNSQSWSLKTENYLSGKSLSTRVSFL